jgi:hypothetical protein
MRHFRNNFCYKCKGAKEAEAASTEAQPPHFLSSAGTKKKARLSQREAAKDAYTTTSSTTTATTTTTATPTTTTTTTPTSTPTPTTTTTTYLYART